MTEAPHLLSKQAKIQWSRHRIIVCVGTGGVGKTTVAAGMALASASCGRRTVVLTIDPSKRLLQALGLKEGGHHGVQAVSLDNLADMGANKQRRAHLDAQVLDVGDTFDAMVRSRAPNQAAARAILDNKIYRHFSKNLIGSHEYAAIETLYALVQNKEYDTIIIDTPPAQHALDFLQAPRRVLRFLETHNLGRIKDTDKFALRLSKKILSLGGTWATRTVAKVCGTETLNDIMQFLDSLTGMYDTFKERAEAVEELLASDAAAFVLVATASLAQQHAMARFKRELEAAKITPKALVINRLSPKVVEDKDTAALLDAVTKLLDGSDRAACAAINDALAHAMASHTHDAKVLKDLAEHQSPHQDIVPLIEQMPTLDERARLVHVVAQFMPQFQPVGAN